MTPLLTSDGKCQGDHTVVFSSLKSLILTIVILLLMSSPKVRIFSPVEKPYGLSYEEHIRNFWNWQISIPASVHPIYDNTGKMWSKCQVNRMLPVIYLSGAGGKTVHRTCKIPADKGVLIPIMTMIATDREYPRLSASELFDIARADQDNVVSISLTINKDVYRFNDLRKFRTHTSEFDVEFPEDGIFGVKDEGRSKAVADGYYVLTEPLKSENQYKIHFDGSISKPPFKHDIEYILNVV
jgi:hypothetical protein